MVYRENGSDGADTIGSADDVWYEHLTACFSALQEALTAFLAADEPNTAEPSTLSHAPLADLLSFLKPDYAELASTPEQQADDSIRRLERHLKQQPEHARVLLDYVLELLRPLSMHPLLGELGILAKEEFGVSLRRHFTHQLLPPLPSSYSGQALFSSLFDGAEKNHWLNLISEDVWIQFFKTLLAEHSSDQSTNLEKLKPEDAPVVDSLRLHARQTALHHWYRELAQSIMVLSYQITAIGLEPEFQYASPESDEFDSPFMAQNRELIDFIEHIRLMAGMQDISVPGLEVLESRKQAIPDPAPSRVMLEQCRENLHRMKRSSRKQGVSLTLTNHLIRLEQTLNRIELLIDLLSTNTEQQAKSTLTLFRQWAFALRDNKSLRALLAINTESLARQITENASRAGEHYVSNDTAGYWQMYRAAAGAGVIIAMMATLKLLIGRLTLAPFSRAFLQSMDYSFGFMLIHMLSFTVATKQPAMTAAALAATLQTPTGTRTQQLSQMAELTVDILRTQFIAIIGNISIAMPVAAVITLGWQHYFNEPLLTPQKASLLLHNLNPVYSLSIPHAAIAGVCLFLAGQIAGYYDNRAIYRKVGPRIRHHPVLKRYFTASQLDHFSQYVERNLGALAGNFWFGVMLGSMGTLGYILGLPLDIRHIAFASANFIQGLLCMEGPIDWMLIAVSFIGVLLIGMTNLLVSFGITLFVALRARRVRYAQWRPLMRLLITHLATRPLDFVWPPRGH